VVLSINLDLFSIHDGLLRYSSNKNANASLADQVKLFVWSPGDRVYGDQEYASLPFDSDRVHQSITDVLEENNQKWIRDEPPWLRQIRIQIIPNGVEQISRTFDVSLYSGGTRGKDRGQTMRLATSGCCKVIRAELHYLRACTKKGGS
jgi:hypothetical protein